MNLVQVAVPLSPGAQPTLIVVPAGSHDEAMRLLNDVGNGLPASVAWGSVLEPIRKSYKRQLERVEMLMRNVEPRSVRRRPSMSCAAWRSRRLASAP